MNPSVMYKFFVKSKGKAVPQGFQEVRVPRFRYNGTRMVVGFQPYAPAVFTPQEMILVSIPVRKFLFINI